MVSGFTRAKPRSGARSSGIEHTCPTGNSRCAGAGHFLLPILHPAGENLGRLPPPVLLSSRLHSEISYVRVRGKCGGAFLLYS